MALERLEKVQQSEIPDVHCNYDRTSMTRKHMTTLRLLASMSLMIFIVLKYNISIRDALASLSHFEWLIVSFVLVLFVIPVVVANRWRLFLLYAGINEDAVTLLKINFVSVFWGILLPSSTGFDAIRIYNIERRHSSSRGIPGSTVIAERLFGFLLLCSIGVVGSLVVTDLKNITFVRVLIFTTMILLSLFVIVVTNKKIYHALLPMTHRIPVLRKPVSYVMNVHQSLTLLPYGKILPSALPLMLIFQLSGILNVYVIFRAMDIHIPFFYHLAIVPIIYIISILPVSISGFGIREGAFVYFYSVFGVDPAVSFTVSVLNYMILMGIPAIIGGVLSIIGHISKTDILPNPK